MNGDNGQVRAETNQPRAGCPLTDVRTEESQTNNINEKKAKQSLCAVAGYYARCALRWPHPSGGRGRERDAKATSRRRGAEKETVIGRAEEGGGGEKQQNRRRNTKREEGDAAAVARALSMRRRRPTTRTEPRPMQKQRTLYE